MVSVFVGASVYCRYVKNFGQGISWNVVFDCIDLYDRLSADAVCKGYRKEPYPAPFILRYIAEKGGHVMINSDSHSVGTILFGFEDAVEYAHSCGIKELSVMKNGKFQPFAI